MPCGSFVVVCPEPLGNKPLAPYFEGVKADLYGGPKAGGEPEVDVKSLYAEIDPQKLPVFSKFSAI